MKLFDFIVGFLLGYLLARSVYNRPCPDKDTIQLVPEARQQIPA